MPEALAVFPATEAAAHPARAALVIDVLSVATPTAGSAETSLSGLPLAPVPQEGENRDGYLIGRTLHRGAYTLLKYATDSRTGEQVVLKFPLPAMLNDRIFRAGFARETWIGHTIRSPVIARIIEPEPGRRSSLYIVMPYYRGETLEARIAREPRFSVGEIVAIALPLCQAVEDLRAVEVLHRDLKPENVMLTTGGGLRLLDLGLAYLAGVEDAGDQGLAGTIRYMAPELLRGEGPDDRTEVYALGVILYRLAAFGRFPGRVRMWRAPCNRLGRTSAALAAAPRSIRIPANASSTPGCWPKRSRMRCNTAPATASRLAGSRARSRSGAASQ